MAERILVADDDEELRELCERLLRSEGYEVAAAADGLQAIKRIDEAEFDLVLTDLQMPGATGDAVVKHIRQRRPGVDSVVMTATPTLATAIATLKAGASDYLLKPFDIEQLSVVVGRVLTQRRLRRELSSERALRRELEHSYKELQKVEELKEAFLARVGHELRTPLTEIVMSLDLENVETAKKGAERMSRVLQELLTFLEMGRRPELSGARELDVEALCRQAAEAAEPLARKQRIAVSVGVGAGLPRITGDPALLLEALGHLMRNAVLFNRENGSIELKAGSKERFVEISVADTGEGIPETEFHHIFDSFYQVANYLTRKVDGLGLGLAITRRIVEAHGGTISVTSKLGAGTTFKVRLPAA